MYKGLCCKKCDQMLSKEEFNLLRSSQYCDNPKFKRCKRQKSSHIFVSLQHQKRTRNISQIHYKDRTEKWKAKAINYRKETECLSKQLTKLMLCQKADKSK
jgi:hypothetical protein